jgi:L-threonylcarbamoyladenylate synthase
MQVFSSVTDSDVVAALQAGAVGVLPTDTLYGLVCRAADQAAVMRLYALKARDHKPGTLIAANIDQLVELGIPRRYLVPVQQFWPGAVSVETPHHIDYLTQSTGRQGIRIPDHPDLLALLTKTGPLQTTSANQPGEPPSTTIAEAQHYFGDSVDFYVDGGDLSNRLPSTIIRIVDDAIEVIREGAVKVEENE